MGSGLQGQGKSFRLATSCVHAGVEPEPLTGAVMTPIFQTSTYAQQAPGEHKGYDYSRGGNPTRDALEKSLAALENARYAVSFSSGLTAIQAIVHGLNPGDHVVVCDDVYGGTGRLFRKLYAKFGIHFDFVDMQDAHGVAQALRPNTRLLWIETPTNPLLRLVPLAQVCELARRRGSITTVVDNTFASPIFQQPLALGADIVVHSATKYLGGHSDLIGGAVMTNDPAWHEVIKFFQFAGGGVNSPMECFLLLRSIKTLEIRMRRHHDNAMMLATEWERMAKDGFAGGVIREVIYPGLASHPQHALASQQMSGYSGIISMRINRDLAGLTRILKRLQVFTLAESLGGVESLVNHPETMTHASVPPDHRVHLGITSDLLRFSVGIEDPADLLDDLRQALAAEG
jgi:cystathionine gamma-lyase